MHIALVQSVMLMHGRIHGAVGMELVRSWRTRRDEWVRRVASGCAWASRDLIMGESGLVGQVCDGWVKQLPGRVDASLHVIVHVPIVLGGGSRSTWPGRSRHCMAKE